MATLGELVVNLIAKTAPFESGIARAKTQLAGFDKTIHTVNATADRLTKNLLTMAAGFVGLRSVVSGVRGEMNRLDEMLKLSARSGIAFDTLQGLAFGAELSGTGFEQLTSAIEKYSSNIGKAQYGTSRATKALAALHLTASQLTKLDLADQLGLLADRLNAMPDVEIRMGIARDLFGDVGILNFLAEGSEGIAKLTNEAKNIGIVSVESAKQMEKANDDISRITFAWKRLMAEMAGPVSTSLITAQKVLALNRKGFSQGLPWGARLAEGAMRDAFAKTGIISGGNYDDELKLINSEIRSPMQLTTKAERDAAWTNRMASQGLGRLGGSAASGLTDAAQGLKSLATGIAGEVSGVVRPMLDRQTTSWQSALLRGRIVSGIGALAAFGQSLIGGVDLSKYSQGGGFDTGQAKIGGSRAAIEAQAQRAREHQVAIEKEQLLKLQEMAKALLDPARLTTFVVTSLGG